MSIELIVLDVDGTMTDGMITYTQSGDEVKSFCVKDGLAIASWIRMGKGVAIITGRESKIVQRRAEELGIEHLYQGVSNKREVLDNLLSRLGLTMENIASIGDDLNDYSMLFSSKISFVPSNSSHYVKDIADVILSNQGGEGAVREMIEQLVVSEGLEEKYLKLWV
jgi:3-deoxy-D-manno-octulosonate 8-phosphate phosphatase (KDO 8-P phosphatase)